MTLKDLLKKKEKVEEGSNQPDSNYLTPEPEFTIIRTTTTTEEVISPPTFPGDREPPKPIEPRRSRLRKLSNASQSTTASVESTRPKGDRRLSERLHLTSRSRTASSSSINLPENLPDIKISSGEKIEEQEAQWEKRATILAKTNPLPRPGSPTVEYLPEIDIAGEGGTNKKVADAAGDENIQEAIRLHEAGDLERSTKIFGRLADPNGANNALSQVLYGLALRHGWGCTPDPERAITYLSSAASNSAEIESLALAAGMKKGGAAKGELTLAIFELANCFRHGWGVKKDAPAAKQYYETAANLGDTDAMNEVAWCYVEGFGCKKDKFKAAQYLRRAEELGSKTIGNTWIWKDKYGGPRKT